MRALKNSHINNTISTKLSEATFNQQTIEHNTPLFNSNTKLSVQFILWCAVSNQNQLYDEAPKCLNSKLLKNKTINELLASMPQKQLKAANQFLERHPITVLGYNYQTQDRVTVGEISKHVLTTPFYGPFIKYSDDYFRVCQIRDNKRRG